jgi:hypothetical protein
MLSRGAEAKTAALLTTTFSRPNAAFTAAMAARTEVSERTSHSTHKARRPACSISLAVCSAWVRELR